jgi:hypothetical protein
VIPKIFHFIWVGDEAKRPDNCIQTWRDAHPGWEFRIWGNQELTTRAWVNHVHIEAMLPRELNGVADMMRWEILHEHGGVVFDADSICLRALDDELLDCEAFACWENEIVRPGLIAAGYFGCQPGNTFVRAIIDDIAASPSVVEDMAWKTVGPQRLTDCYRKFAYSPLAIYPSHYFIPKHFTGQEYQGKGPVYAHQLWGSTLQAYDHIHAAPIELPGIAPTEASASRLADAQGDAGLVQQVSVGTELAGLDRLSVFASLCAGKRVLHVGCSERSLHVALEEHCAALDGVALWQEAFEALRPQVRGRLFADLRDVTGSYDIVLVPDVMQNEPDVTGFLRRIEAIDAHCFLISVPDAFQCATGSVEFVAGTDTVVGIAHPDVTTWYTPYTLSDTIRKHSGFNIERLWFFDETSILALLSKPSLAMAA